MKNSDTSGNRSRDLSVCSAVPQPLRHRDMCQVWGEKGTNRDTHNGHRGNLKERGHLEDLLRRWKDDIEVAKQTGWDGFYCVHLSQDRTKRWALQRPMKCVERLA
jgi:hypothetical protein